MIYTVVKGTSYFTHYKIYCQKDQLFYTLQKLYHLGSSNFVGLQFHIIYKFIIKENQETADLILNDFY